MINQVLIDNIANKLNEPIFSIQKINAGYSREVYLLNNKYILKIVCKLQNENNSLRELQFLKEHNYGFTSKIIFSDTSKSIIPYFYFLETLLPGTSLLFRWASLSTCEKKDVLIDLIAKLHVVHNYQMESDCLQKILEEFEEYLELLIRSELLVKEQIRYLESLRNIIPKLFIHAKVGLIHGDLHFNNILITDNNNISLIDFEKLNFSFVEREYDPINRMIRNPNSFINNGSETALNSTDFSGILEFVKENDDSVDKEMFEKRLLLFDCLNSMKWLIKYPDYDLYHNILFQKSRKLIN